MKDNTQYLITCRQACAGFNGERIVQPTIWKDFWAFDKGKNHSDEEIDAWWEELGFESPYKKYSDDCGLIVEPGEEEPCDDCDGKGYSECQVDLKEALINLGFKAGLPDDIEWALNSGDGVYRP